MRVPVIVLGLGLLAAGPAAAGRATDGYDLMRALAPDTLVDAGFRARTARLSPDGETVVFVAPGANGRAALHARPLAGGPSRVLVSGEFDVGSPAFSGDGGEVYFHSSERGPEKIFSVRLEDGFRRQVTFGDSHDLNPSVAANGGRLAFDSDREGGYDVWVQDLMTGALERVTLDPAPDFFPALSPDGSRIAFTSSRAGGWHIWAKPVGRGAAYPLSRGSAADAHPVASPDGRFVAFDSDRSGREELWVVPWEGGGPVKVPTRHGRSRFPSFHPASNQLIFTAETLGVSTIERVEVPAELRKKAPPSRRRPRKRPAPAASAQAALPARPPAAAPAVDADMAAHAALAPGAGAVRILSFQPTDREGGVPRNAPVFVAFAQDVEPVGGWTAAVVVEDSSGRVPSEALYNPGLRRLEIQPARELAAGSEVRISLEPGRLRGKGGLPFHGFSWTFRRDLRSGRERIVVDPALAKPLRVAGVLPPHGSADVEPRSRVAVKFSRPFDPRSISEAALVLEAPGGRRIPGELRMVRRDTTLVLAPYEDLSPGMEYTARISKDVKDARGGALQVKQNAWTFQVRHGTPLRIAAIEPEDGVLPQEGAITLSFNRQVSSESLETGELVLEGGGISHKGNMVLDSTGKLLLFQPYSRLPAGTEFVLHLPPGLSDRAGNALKLDAPLRFQTGGAAAAADASSLLARHLGTVEGELPGAYLAKSGGTSAEAPKWSVAVLRGLQRKGYLDQALAGNLERSAVLTRYKAAMLVDSARRRTSAMSSHERAAVGKLEKEFAGELSKMGHTLAGSVSLRGAL